MKYKQLGKTGMNVSALGFGGIPIQRLEAEEASEVLRQCRAQGINFYDTARMYGDSEEKLGNFIQNNDREGLYLATKSMARDYQGMLAEIKASLDLLQCQYIDLYQLHNVASEQDCQKVLAPDGALAALRQAQSDGLVRHIGITGHKPEILEPLVRTGAFATLQIPYSPLEQQAKKLLQVAKEEYGMGTIAMKPLSGGALTTARAALAKIVDSPWVDTAIPGMESGAQVVENCSIFTNPLSAEEEQQLATLVSSLGNNFCRRCEYCQPCPRGLKIPAMFLFEGYYSRYNLTEWALERYGTLSVKASDCDECGICESKCPYDLPIRQMLKQTAVTLERDGNSR